jgi:hypothetical protein
MVDIKIGIHCENTIPYLIAIKIAPILTKAQAIKLAEAIEQASISYLESLKPVAAAVLMS